MVVKSEGTRAIAYCVKSLHRKESSATNAPAIESRRQEAIEALSQPPFVQALVNLFVRGQKHAILLNESSFALTLISSRPSGGKSSALDPV